MNGYVYRNTVAVMGGNGAGLADNMLVDHHDRHLSDALMRIVLFDIDGTREAKDDHAEHLC